MKLKNFFYDIIKCLYPLILMLGLAKGAFSILTSIGWVISGASMIVLIYMTLLYVIIRKKLIKFATIDYLVIMISVLVILYSIPTFGFQIARYRMSQILLLNIPLYFIGRILFKSRKDIIIFSWVYVISAVPFLLVSLFNYFVCKSFWYAHVGVLNYAVLAFALAALIVFVMSHGVFIAEKWGKVIYIFIVCSLIPLFAVFPRRGTVISFGIAILILMLIVLVNINKFKNGRKVFLYLLFIIIFEIIIIFISKDYILSTPLAARLKVLLSADVSASIHVRLLYMKEAFRNLSIIGHGTAGFECIHGLGDYIHNFPLEAFYDYGVFGIVLILWVIKIFIISIKLLKKSLNNNDIYGLFLSVLFLILFFEKIGSSLSETRLLFALSGIIYNESRRKVGNA
jgi:hypothetical protein